MDNLNDRAKTVLKERGYTKDFFPLEDLASDIQGNWQNAVRKVRIYKWTAAFVLFGFPLLSACVSLFMPKDGPFAGVSGWVPYLSALLTILAVVNSVMKPGERFPVACKVVMRINEIADLLLEDLGLLDQADEKSLAPLVQKYRAQLAPIQEQLIYLFLPTSSAPAPDLEKKTAGESDEGKKAAPGALGAARRPAPGHA